MAKPRSTRKPTLTRPSDTDARAEKLLADALKGRGGALTKSDAIALTGLPADDTESALRSLLSRYKSHLAVTDQGELVYRFDPAMERRDKVGLKERLDQVGTALWKGFTFLFKIWIVGTLAVYTIAFFAMMLALLLSRGDSDSDDDGPGLGGWLVWWMMPSWGPQPAYSDRRRLDSRYGHGRQRALMGRGQGDKPDKKFYQSVFDFVFGPRQAAPDGLAQDREVVAFIRSFDGRITAADLVALTGWSFERADEEMTRLLVDYDGEPEVREDGSLIYVFPSLRKTAAALAGSPDRALLPAPSTALVPAPNTALVPAPTTALVGRRVEGWSYAWGKQRTLAPLTGNTPGANTAITVMNGFNLIAALVIAPAFMAKFHIDPSLVGWFMTFPLAFSAVFYAVPGLRALKRRREERKLRDEAVRAALIGAIVNRDGVPTMPALLVGAAGQNNPSVLQLAPARTRKILDQLLVELDGDVVTDVGGEIQYVFPRITAEGKAVAEARRLAPASEREIGAVEFASDEEGSGEVPALETPNNVIPLRLLN